MKFLQKRRATALVPSSMADHQNSTQMAFVMPVLHMDGPMIDNQCYLSMLMILVQWVRLLSTRLEGLSVKPGLELLCLGSSFCQRLERRNILEHSMAFSSIEDFQ